MEVNLTGTFAKKAIQLFPGAGIVESRERAAYIRGCIDTANELTTESSSFYEEIAKGLKKLWPSGEKDGKYSWQDSVSNLVKRLEFIWKNRDLKGKYTVEDCLVAGRKYLSQFQDNAKYMQTLKYFVFKQDKLVSPSGKVTYVYKSTLADLLENNTDINNEWEEAFESSNTIEQGVLI